MFRKGGGRDEEEQVAILRTGTKEQMNTDSQLRPLIATHDELEASKKPIPPGWSGIMFYLVLSSYWFAQAILLAAVTSIVWPSQIATIVGNERKEEYNGILPAFGALVSLTVTPIAGVFSDHSTSRFGRRKIFILSGSIVATGFAMAGGLLEKGDNVWLMLIIIMGIQAGSNWASGPYAGLMPDIVPHKNIGTASGFLGLTLAVGDLVGVLGAGLLIPADDKYYWPAYMFLAGCFIFFSLVTVLFVEELPVGKIRPPDLTFKKFFSSFYLDPKKYRDFYWVIITRFLEQMGIFSILPIMQYFLEDIVKVKDKELYASYCIVLIVLASVPSSMVAGKLSDKYGRKPLVYVSSGLMAAVMVAFIGLSLIPSLTLVFISCAIFGLGYGAYQAVDWALALDVLPPDANIAKDMGIWHISVVMPQMISPLITALILKQFKADGSLVLGYSVVFAVTAFWFILATVMVFPVRVRARG